MDGWLDLGHYANVHALSPTHFRLCQPMDQKKDQTYFLASISSESLSKTLFPLAHLKKKDVKAWAMQIGFQHIALQKESMGICFIGERKKFGNFLKEYLVPTPGHFISLEDGRVLGKCLRSLFGWLGS
ncbi:hypothetical protein HMI56_003964 [Coelomomyces lativittatus]|nr:hypothetical protein HMI56_003964 [Coelomomyces lativittatus]